MKKLYAIILLFFLISTACTPTNNQANIKKLESDDREKSCGDRICDGPEGSTNCSLECKEDLNQIQSSTNATNIHWVNNPTSGGELYVEILKPDGMHNKPLPTLVLVPGGSGDSNDFTQNATRTFKFLEAGFILVVFDPDGRGRSGGSEDNNGYLHQDGLTAIIEYIAALPEIDETQIGLVTYSYGITMGAGALARHSNLPIRFLIDWEGPANRDDTGGCDADNLGHLTDYNCDDEDFWSEREASTFASDIRVPYLRLQSQTDHVQPDNDHAILMINNATSTAFGGEGRTPWTRLNNLSENTIYSFDNPPAMLPDEMDNDTQNIIVNSAIFLFNLVY